MRIVFPHSDREEVRWTQPALTIGSAADNDLVLAKSHPHHLRLVRDARGCVLDVLASACRVYLNARPVREHALLHEGDILSVGDTRLIVCGDVPVAFRKPAMLAQEGRIAVALRAVAGPLSGRVLAIGVQLELGPHGQWPLELPSGGQAALLLDWTGEGCLRVRMKNGGDRYPLRVNGQCVAECALHAGDQLGIARHRFILDAPGLRPPETVPAAPSSQHMLADEAYQRGEAWWLIVTATVLALGIALMLLIRLGAH